MSLFCPNGVFTSSLVISAQLLTACDLSTLSNITALYVPLCVPPSRHSLAQFFIYLSVTIPNRMYDAAVKRGEEIEEHDYPRNFEGISKSMESGAILKMTEYAFRHCCYIIYIIVSDNEIKMQAVLKNS